MMKRAWCQRCDWRGPWHETEAAAWWDFEEHEAEEHGTAPGVVEFEDDR